MNADQNSKFEMFERAIKVCNDNPTKVALNPAFQEDKEALENLLPNMRRLSQTIKVGNVFSETKAKTKNDMIAAGLDICTNLNGYGKKINDVALVKISSHTKSTLGKGKEADVLERCQTIADKARTLVTELVSKRGMKASLLTQYEALLQEYRDVKSEPRSAIQERSVLIKELDAEFDKADAAFELMVGCAVNLKGEADEFLTRFEKAVIIIAPRTSATKINFIVQDGVTTEKITDYNVENDSINVTRTPLAARSLAMPSASQNKGEKKGKGVGSDFTITSEGYEPATLKDLKIKRGKVNNIKVVLMPITIN